MLAMASQTALTTAVVLDAENDVNVSKIYVKFAGNRILYEYHPPYTVSCSIKSSQNYNCAFKVSKYG